MVRSLVLAIAAAIAVAGGAGAACSPPNGSCKIADDCCQPGEHPAVTTDMDCRNGCKPRLTPLPPPTTTTTTRSTTSTTRTSPTTSTTTSRPTTTTRASDGGGPLAMYVPTFGHIGLHWTAQSQEMMYDHATGAPLDQADAWGQLLFLRFVVEPEAVEAASLIPSCVTTAKKMRAARHTTTDKFTADYVLRALLTGTRYEVHGNYLWDLTHNAYLEPFQACLLAQPQTNASWLAVNAHWQQALDLRVADGAIVRGDPSYEIPAACAGESQSGRYSCATADMGHTLDSKAKLAGAVTTAFKDQILSPTQCAALAAFRRAHDLGTDVVAKGRAFLATARTKREQTLFAMPFTTHVHPTRLGKDGALQAKKHAGFAEWQRAFGCETQTPPDIRRVIVGLLRHCFPHAELAVPPGDPLRDICAATVRFDGDGILPKKPRVAVVNCPFIEPRP